MLAVTLAVPPRLTQPVLKIQHPAHPPVPNPGLLKPPPNNPHNKMFIPPSRQQKLTIKQTNPYFLIKMSKQILIIVNPSILFKNNI